MLIFCLHCIKAVVSKTCGGVSDILLNKPEQCVVEMLVYGYHVKAS